MSDGEVPTINELKRLRVVDLKDRLLKLDLSTAGLKADLVNRLYEACQKSNKETNEDADEGESESGSEISQEDEEKPAEQMRLEEEEEEEEEDEEEEEERKKAEEERLRIEEEQKRQAEEEEERLRIEEEQKLRKEEEERLRIEEEQKRQAEEEEERLRIEEEQKLRKEEEERLRIEEEQKKRKEEQERLRIEEEQKRQAEEERLRKEEEERLRIEQEEILRKAEVERLRIEEEQQRLREEERLRKEEEKRLRIEEEQRRLADEQRKKAVEEERLRLEEQRRKAEEEKFRLQEEARKKAEEERIRIEAERKLAEEEERLRREEEGKKKLQAERLRIQEEEREKAEEEQRKEAERLRIEEQRKEAERLRLEQVKKEAEQLRFEEEQRRKAEEEKKQHFEEQQRRKAEEEKRQRLEEERKKKAQEEERLHLEAQRKETERVKMEEEQRRKAKETERIRLEEQKKVAEKLRIEKQRKEAEEAEKRKILEEKKKQAEEAERKRAEEAKRKMELEQKLKAEEIRKNASNIPKHPSVSAGMTPQAALPRIEAAAGPQKPTPSTEVVDDSITDENIELPQALEKALAFKSERAQQVGVNPEDVDTMDVSRDADAEGDDEDESMDILLSQPKTADSEVAGLTESKNKRRKKKKKRRARNRLESQQELKDSKQDGAESEQEKIEIEYIQETLEVTNPTYLPFMKIFERFRLDEPGLEESDAKVAADKEATKIPDFKKKGPPSSGEDSDDDDEVYPYIDIASTVALKNSRFRLSGMSDFQMMSILFRAFQALAPKDDKPKLSKKKQKLASRLSVAELKQKVSRPDLVEMHDVTAKDPEILLALKATRNSVPVPRHWCFKRKYLQGKRGIEKPPFDLPHFIKKTGIMEMRQALAEKEDQKTLKAKIRERVRPKMGKIDIDYQKLHDAFFKWQTKPKMTIHGDLYYEGKEFETKMKDKKPGDLSDELRTALGMPVGPSCNRVPPPWLIAMQRYGPPPSYPNLKIPGLNAPIPDGCSFGYHAGGWGKPPVDELGRPLYGDVFGIQNSDYQNQLLEEEIDKTQWGELESESSESSAEEEEEEEEEEETEEREVDQTGLITPADGGLITPSGITSIPAGMETPDMIELRKRKIEADMEGGDTPALYTILPEKKMEKLGGAMMGSTHAYDMSAAISKKATPAGSMESNKLGVEVALDPSELDMDTAAMAARYEQTVREQESQLEKEDLSDMVAEHAAKQKSKRKKAQQDSGKAAKRYKEFKF
ncbi:Splicing factor 3B subunit 2 [Nymphon striatum]|nr:Splicing factor 3B subunit 2 [Nymphon striatum]